MDEPKETVCVCYNQAELVRLVHQVRVHRIEEENFSQVLNELLTFLEM
jgi:hypothetical protein